MSLDEIKKAEKELKKDPWKTLWYLFVLIIITIVVSWGNGYFGAKGEQVAIPRQDVNEIVSESDTKIEPDGSQNVFSVGQNSSVKNNVVVNPYYNNRENIGKMKQSVFSAGDNSIVEWNIVTYPFSSPDKRK